MIDSKEAMGKCLKQCEEMLLKTGGKIFAMVRSLGTPSLSVIEMCPNKWDDLAK